MRILNTPAMAPETLATWIAQRIGAVLEIDAATLDHDVQFADMGIDSIMAVALVGELEDLLGADLEPTLLYSHPTIDELVRFLCAAPR